MFAEMQGVDKIATIRKVWYSSLKSLSDLSFDHETVKSVRSHVMTHFKSNLEETRAVDTVLSHSNSSSKRTERPTGNFNTRNRATSVICDDYNSPNGCPQSEASCGKRHICAYHYRVKNEAWSNHGENSCREKSRPSFGGNKLNTATWQTVQNRPPPQPQQ